MSNYTKLEVYKCDFLNVRTGPSTNYKIIDKLYPKQIVEVQSKKGNWARIVHKGGFAWCSLLYLRSITNSLSPTTAMVMTATAAINIRTTPSWSGVIIEAVKKGTELLVVDYQPTEAFSKVWYANTYAYAPSKYLKDTGRIVEGVGEGEEEDNEGDIPELPLFAEAPRYNVEYKNKWWIECYSPDYPELYFNTSNLNMSMLEKPVEQLELLKTDTVDNIIHNGDIVYAEGTYSTTTLEVEFYMLKENYNVAIQKLRQLCQIQEFRLILGWDRSFYRKARLGANIEIEEYDFDDVGYKVVLEFIIQPFRYSLSGTNFVKDRKTNKQTLVNGSEFYNNHAVSLPKIYIDLPHKSLVEANTDGEKIVRTQIYSQIDDTCYELDLYAHDESYGGIPVKALHLIVDCENELIYEETTNRNFNYLLSLASDFPKLKPGLLRINRDTKLDETGFKLKIVPQWREF